MTLREEYPAAFTIQVGGGELLYPEVYADILQRAKAAGVRALLEYMHAPPEATFTLDGVAGQGFYDETGLVEIGEREDLFDPLGTSASGPVLAVTGPVSGVTTAVQVRIFGSGGAYDSAQFEYSADDGATWNGVVVTDDLPWEVTTGLEITSFGTGGNYSGGELYRWELVVIPAGSGGILASVAYRPRG